MGERRAVLFAGCVAAGLYLAAFGLLSMGGILRSRGAVLVAVLLLTAAALLLQLTLSRARARRLVRAWVRWALPAGIVVIGGVAALLWWLGTRSGHLTGGVGLAGVCAAYLGAGQLLAEARADDRHPVRDGLAAIGLCALLYGAGLIAGLTASAAWIGAAVVGILLAPVGLTLLSEGVLREPRGRTTRAALAGAALVVGAGGWLWFGLGLPASLVIALAVAACVLLVAIASNTQADVLLVVTVLLLFYAARPSGVAADDTIGPAGHRPTLVALGDSYISGEGASEFFKGTNDAGVNECRRSPTAYPHVVVQEGHAGALEHLAFFACSGAKADDVVSRAQYPGEPIDGTPRQGSSQLAQLGDLLDGGRADPRLVVVSIGGNDAGFADIATACLAPGSCVERGQLWLDRLPRVAQQIEWAYARIREVVGNDVPVLVVPYPVPISTRHCGYSQLSGAEARFLQRFVEQLDGAIQQSARDAGFYYLSEMVGALGRARLRICDRPDETQVGVNFVRVKSVDGVVDQVLKPYTWLHNSFHPNELGHGAMASVLSQWIASHPDPPAKPDPNDIPKPFVPARLDQLMGAAAGSYCLTASSSRPRYCNRGDRAWALTQMTEVVWGATPALLVLVAGWWLLWLPVLERTRPAFHGRGVEVGRWLFGEGGQDSR